MLQSIEHRPWNSHTATTVVTVPHRSVQIPPTSLSSYTNTSCDILSRTIRGVDARRSRSFSTTSSPQPEETEPQPCPDAAATTTESAATASTTVSEAQSLKTSTTGSGDDTNSQSQKNKTTTSKNSYLVIKLEQKVLQNLYNDVQSMQTKFLSSVKLARQAAEKHYGTTNYIDTENQPLQLQIRNHDALELILFSGGMALNTIPPDLLQQFYTQVVDRLDRAGFASTHSSRLKDGNIAHPDDYWFRVNAFKLFPPTTKHLLVVTFDTSIAWMCLYEDIQLIANKFPELPQRPMQKNQVLRWLPLIVMADVSGGTGHFIKEQTILQNIVTHWTLDSTSSHQTICMGGTMPSQITPPLDWNFHDSLRKRPDNEDEILESLDKGEEFWKVKP